MKPWTRKDRRGLSKSLWPITVDSDKRGPSVKRARLVSGNEISDLEAIPGCEFQVCKLPPGRHTRAQRLCVCCGADGKGWTEAGSFSPPLLGPPPSCADSFLLPPPPYPPLKGNISPYFSLRQLGKKKKKRLALGVKVLDQNLHSRAVRSSAASLTSQFLICKRGEISPHKKKTRE